MRALVQSKLCWDDQRAARGLLAQTAAAAGSGLQRSRSLVQEQVERHDFIVMIPCDSTRRRRPFFRRRVSDPSRDNRSISRRASDSPARGRAGGPWGNLWSEREIVELQPSFVRPSFVRSGVTADHLGWKNKELDPGPKSCIERLGTWVKRDARRIGLGVSFFFSPFFLCHLPPSRPTQPLGTWVKFTHFPSPFCSSPSISTHPPSLLSHPSLVPISFVYMLYSLFWANIPVWTSLPYWHTLVNALFWRNFVVSFDQKT